VTRCPTLSALMRKVPCGVLYDSSRREETAVVLGVKCPVPEKQKARIGDTARRLELSSKAHGTDQVQCRDLIIATWASRRGE